MKGYRKLRVGEIIKEGDVWGDGDKLKMFFGDRCVSDIYRPITKKAMKVKTLHEELFTLGLHGSDLLKVMRFIRRNYRRKE